jgi:phospholipase C
MHAGQSYGNKDNALPFASGGFPDNTIFAALSRKGISNRYFFSDLPVSSFWGTAGIQRSGHVQEYYERCANGTLPAVSYVDPSFQGEDQGTSGDEHPLGDVRAGQAFISDVAHAFIESKHYRRGALFIVYDEWGGFFDHVAPPRVPDLRSSRNLNQDFGQMGFRIPATVISPFARQGHVDHTIYGFESILKLIRYRFGLPPLTPRDLYANNIAYSLDFDHPNYANRGLPSPAHIIATACSGTVPVDSGGTGLGLGGITTQPLLATDRGKPHDLYDLYTSGYLDRLGFHYEPAKPSTMFRHPSSMGFTK